MGVLDEPDRARVFRRRRMSAIILEDVSFAYRTGRGILAGLDLRFEVAPTSDRGWIVALMGGSGTGKSTLLRLIAGVERPSRGRVRYEPAGMVVSYLQQEPVIFEHLSRFENARYFEKVGNLRERFRQDVFERAIHWLKLEDVIAAPGSVLEMSGGERQRLALLRSLSVCPGVLLLDEPCTGLDAPVKKDFLRMLREIVDASRLIALYATHHPEEAELAADEIVYLDRSGSDGPALVSRRELGEFLEHPPTLEGAQAFSRLGWNVLRCSIEHGGVLRSLSGEAIGSCSASLAAGEYLLVVAPNAVRWTSGPGQRIRLCGRSAKYLFAQIDGDGEAVSIIGPFIPKEPERFVLSGTAIAFGPDGGVGKRIQIAPAEP